MAGSPGSSTTESKRISGLESIFGGWWYDHPRVALTIFPDQYSGKVNVVSPNHGTPCIFNGERCISGEIHTASIGSSWKKNLKELLL